MIEEGSGGESCEIPQSITMEVLACVYLGNMSPGMEEGMVYTGVKGREDGDTGERGRGRCLYSGIPKGKR